MLTSLVTSAARVAPCYLRCCSSKASLIPRIAEELRLYINGLGDSGEPVVRLKSPEQLDAIFSANGVGFGLENQGTRSVVIYITTCTLSFEILQTIVTNCQDSPLQQCCVRHFPCAGALDDDALVEAVKLVLKYSVRTGHPLFLNQLYSQADEVSILGDWVSASTNTNAHTFEVAPVYAMIEAALIQKVASLLGGRYQDEADGLFVPGGSLSNLYGMHLARNRVCPDFATKGAGGQTHVAFTSDQSHYSYLKSARLTGLGSDNLVCVPTDGHGRMIPEKLEQAILRSKSEGKVPFFVGSTAGTTVIGAFDPFEDINDICRSQGLWHHVDGCWGGSSLLSTKTQHLMRGIGQVDSFAWNPHKMVGSALQTSCFMVPSASVLKECNATNASYLFQPDKLYTQLDTGDKTIQCGRKTDMLKLWLQWKARGDEGLARSVEHSFDLAQHTVDRMREDPDAWVLVYPPSCTNVCFWYVQGID